MKGIGTMLYWCEGYKTEQSSTVDFANSDPHMIAVFVRFLRTVCGVNEARLRVYLYQYSNQDTDTLIRFWSRITGIPTTQFTKPYVRTGFREDKKDKMPHGLIHIRYHDKKLLLLIKDWIGEYKNNFCVGTEVVKRGAL